MPDGTVIAAFAIAITHLTPNDCIVEMEFYLPLKPMQAPALNKLLTAITGQPSFLSFDNVKGMLKGFIDLIFCWQEQFFVLDYKSNYLGENSADYQQDNLESAMSSHQYHLQYMIYTVALHRLLQHRLAHYDPEQHLGGCYYLFLRALPDHQGIYFKRLTLELARATGCFIWRGRMSQLSMDFDTLAGEDFVALLLEHNRVGKADIALAKLLNQQQLDDYFFVFYCYL